MRDQPHRSAPGPAPADPALTELLTCAYSALASGIGADAVAEEMAHAGVAASAAELHGWLRANDPRPVERWLATHPTGV